MRKIIFGLLVLIVGGAIALGMEWLARLLPDQLEMAMLRVYDIGIHPFGLVINLCGLLGLILSYLIISKFMKK